MHFSFIGRVWYPGNACTASRYEPPDRCVCLQIVALFAIFSELHFYAILVIGLWNDLASCSFL